MYRVLLGLLAISAPSLACAASPPPVGADHAMVVSAQRLASEVGVQIMKQGGNVVDAAVGVGYALAVVWPAAGNLGGGGFMSIRLADGRSTFLDFREKAPSGATETMFQDAAGHVVPGRSTEGWLAVGVPGSVAGLDWALSHYGTLPRSTVMAPAIKLARDGFELGPADVTLLDAAASDFAKDPDTAAIFLHQGKPFEAGETLRQPALAATLDAISLNGASAFYGGAIGKAIAEASRAGGGLLQEQDLAAYKPRELAPVRCSYRGYDIQSAPPPSAGGTALCEILGILEGYDLRAAGFHSARSIHLTVEAMRRAFHDRQNLGDPDFVGNSTSHLLDKDYAAKLRGGIAPDKATPSASLEAGPASPEGQQTTHFSIADAAGNAVSVTTTLNGWFGIRRVAGTTGILMNNEMDDFASAPAAPNMFGLAGSRANAVAPGKTPLSSMSPTIVTRDGKLVLVIGSPGGSRIISTTLQVILNVVDYGMSLGEAIDAPRVHEQWTPEPVEIEPYALSPDTRHILEIDGYTFREKAPWGQAEGILTGAPDLAGTGSDLSYLDRPSQPHPLYGASDDRGAAGAAVGY